MNDKRLTTSQTNLETPQAAGHEGHGGHGWMMIACCIPMLVIAFALVATGVAGPSFIVAAIACTAMMAFMMGGMDHGGHSKKP